MSLEPEFWRAFRDIASARTAGLNELAAEIDAARGADRGLASAIRVFVLDWHRGAGGVTPSPA